MVLDYVLKLLDCQLCSSEWLAHYRLARTALCGFNSLAFRGPGDNFWSPAGQEAAPRSSDDQVLADFVRRLRTCNLVGLSRYNTSPDEAVAADGFRVGGEAGHKGEAILSRPSGSANGSRPRRLAAGSFRCS